MSNLHRILLLLLPAALVMAEQPYPVCNVCGPDHIVTAPDNIYDYPNMPDVTCGKLNIEGVLGKIEPASCRLFPALLADICCGPAPEYDAPVPAPSSVGPTPTRGTDLGDAGKDVNQDRKSPDQIFRTKNNSSGMSSGGKAALGVFLGLLSVLAIVGAVILVKKNKNNRPRTAMGNVMDPDGTNIQKGGERDEPTVVENNSFGVTSDDDDMAPLEDIPVNEIL